jgi:hypothetical protein
MGFREQAIAMREMELWRDKIQLRIRDRIQDSASFSIIFQAIFVPFISLPFS